MRKTFKKIIFTIFVFIISIGMVNAETISNSLTMTSYKYSSTPLKFPQTFRVKKTSTGKYAYCTYYSKTPPSGQTFKKGKLITDKGMSYILNQSVIDNANSNSDFFVYQTALWIYMVDKGIMPGSYNSIKTFKSTVNNSSSATATKIKKLVSNAKKASSNNTSAPTIKIADTSNVKFTLSNGKYVSDKITVTSSTGDFKVSLTNAPSGTTYEKGSNYIKIIVPADKVSSLSTNIKFSVNNSKNVYYAYTYTTSSSSYQTMAVPFKETKTASSSASVELERTASATISKQDITTSEELPGASLVVTNSNGKIIDEWVSTTEPHIINNLSKGTYTLKETIAPNGYILSEETITFKIDSNGKLIDENGKETSKIVMYNQKEEVPEEPKGGGVSISKQDITNKEELPGAHLVIKDYDGNVIDEWISTDKPHMIEDLKPGIYTLNETVAPNGYILSDETITFTVKDDGSITKVVMYNTPDTKEVPEEPKQEVQVEDTASFKTMTSAILGLGIILVGLSLIIKNKKEV